MRLPRLPALAAAVLCAWTATSVGTDGVEKPPHILTIIVDDMGFADTMIHNPTSFMTPEFGRLARTGITLLRHHTYLCARPSRPSTQPADYVSPGCAQGARRRGAPSSRGASPCTSR